MKSEILAPAGGMPQLIAGVRCGAGAVYLGTQGFNARRNAANFDAETLPQAVSYCHGRDTRVYVTVNTVIMDGELEKLEAEADMIASCGADGVIIQDLAVMELFRRRYPGIKRYASTQTAVHDLYGALKLEEMGFDGIVLARELTLREMEKICSRVSVKTEAFIHGAHCMSVSGACYMSAMLGGRSGNRGLCAQPCRLDWKCGEKDHALSLKDMSLLGHIREMADIGVECFKIEGRMKRPEYVAAAVTACRLALAGEPYDIDTLKAVFSRSGFTDGYLTGKRDEGMFGVRTREDVTGAEKVLRELENSYRAEAPRVPVSFSLDMDERSSSLAAESGGCSVTVAGPIPEPAQTRATDDETARRYLSKTGGTPFYLDDLRVSVRGRLMLPAAALNAMRRQALELLLSAKEKLSPHTREVREKQSREGHIAPPSPAIWARFRSPDAVVRADALERVILPVDTIKKEHVELYGDKLTCQLPFVCFPDDEDGLFERLKALKAMGLKAVWADNIYGLGMAQKLGLEVLAGPGLNITNTEALCALADAGASAVTVSFEMPMSGIKALGGAVPRGAMAYGRLPLMHFRNCPVKAFTGCLECGGEGSLTDRMGVKFPVECQERKFSTLLNSVPLHIAEKDLSGLDHAVLYFTRENKDEIRSVFEDFEKGRKFEKARTGGLYYRELL